MQLISRLDRYVGSEILRIFAVILFVLVMILVGGSLIKMLRLAASGSVSPDSVFTLLGLEILRLSGRLIPVSFFFATVMALGRMYQDQEMTVLFSSGISPYRMFRVVFLVSIPMTLISVWLVMNIYPTAGRVVEHINSQHRDAILLSSMEGGRFYEARDGQLVFYAETSDLETGELKDVFLHQRKDDGSVSVTVANKGIHLADETTSKRQVILRDGHQYDAIPGSSEATIVNFDEFNITINARQPVERRVRLKAVSTLDLLDDDSLEASVELQTRLIFPLSVIAFGILAVPLSRSNIRQSAYLRVVFAVGIYLIFMTMISSAETWMLKGATPRWMGVWWIISLMVALAFAMVISDQARFKMRRKADV